MKKQVGHCRTRNQKIKRINEGIEMLENRLCPWFIDCKLDCKECPKCHSASKRITQGCECCDGCNGVSPFKIKRDKHD